MRARLAIAFFVIMTIVGTCSETFAQSAANVLLVVNDSSPASVEIGNYYAQKRGIPAGNIIRLQLPPSESLERPDYERQLENPIGTWLTRNFAQDRILYIVL